MKNFTRLLGLCISLMLFAGLSFGQSYVQFGTGNVESSLPFYTSWKYSYTSTIYTKDDVGGAKTITGIAFNNNFTDLTALGYDFDMPNQKIYLKHVSQSVWSNMSYENPTASGYTLVWTGTVHYGAQGWYTITFDTPFVYNGTDNLVIHWENGSGKVVYSLKNAATTVGLKQVKCSGADAVGVPTTDGFECYPLGTKANIRFYYDNPGMPSNPDLVSPLNNKIKIDLNSPLQFTLGANTNSYDLFFGTNAANLTKVVDNLSVSVAGSYSYTPTSILQPNTKYYWKVVARNINGTVESVLDVFKTQQVVSQFPYNQDFESYWVSTIDPDHPDTLSAVINTNYPDSSAWSWDNGWSCSARSVNNYKGHFSAKMYSFSSGSFSLTTPRMNLSADQRVKFWWKNGFTSEDRISNTDTTYLEVSVDGKHTWKTLKKLCAATNMATYDNAIASLADYVGDNVYVRWRYQSFSSASMYFFLDDISIESNPTGAIVMLSDQILTFPKIVAGAKCAKRVIIFNTGSTDLIVNGITTAGPFTCDFNKTIAPNAHDTAWVYFAPSQVGDFSENVTFNVGGATGTATVLCNGTAVAKVTSYYQSFDAIKAIPDGWLAIQSSKANSVVSNVWITSSTSDVYSAPNAVKMNRINDSDTLDPVILVGPGVTGYATNILSFYAMKGGDSYEQELVVGVMDNPYDASTFIPKSTVMITSEYAKYTVTFKANTTQPYIAFKFGNWTPASPFPYPSLRIDDISWAADVATPPSAAQIGFPLDADVNVDVMSGVNLRWASGSANTNGFKLFVGTTSTNCNEVIDGVDFPANGISYNVPFDDLKYNTVYYWKVVPYNENGNCTEPLTWSFTTMSDPTVTAYPLIENFDEVTNYQFQYDKPLGWTIEDANKDKISWDAVNCPPAMSGFTRNDSRGAMQVPFHLYNPKNDWLYTAPLQMKQGKKYDLEFYIHTLMDYSTGLVYNEEISIWAGNGRVSSSMTDSLVYANVNTSAEWKKVTATYTPTANGVYYFGFHAISVAAQYVLLVDDVKISESSINGIDDQKTVTGLRIYPNPATNYFVIDLPSDISSKANVTVIDVLGKVVNSQSLESGASIDITGLSNGVYLVRVEVDGKSFTRKIFIKK